MTLNKKNRIINIDYERNKLSWCYYIPLLLIAGFVPLIVHGKYIDLTGTTQALYWTGQNQLLDFFSYWKSRWVIFLTATALLIYIFLLITKKLPFKKEYKYYIPLAIYAVFVILSTIFAIDVPTALNGFVDMYQGMWVLLSYVLLTFLTINFVNSERDVKLFLYAFIFLIIVEGLIGVGQYFGFDIFNTKFGNSLIIPSGINVDGGLNFNFGKHTIYGTLFNTNFVGSFATLMLPMAVVFLISAKTTKKRIVAGIALALCLFTWIGCNSRAGYIGVAVTLLVAVIMLRKYFVKYWKIGLSVIISIIVLVVFMNYVTKGMIFNRIQTLNLFTSLEEQKNEKYLRVEDIIINGNELIIDTNINKLYIERLDDKLYFYDEKKESLLLDENNRLITKDGTYTGYNIIMSTYPGAEIGISTGRGWIKMLLYFDENEIKFIGPSNKIVNYSDINFFKPLIGFENFMSSRGYIWGVSIDMLPESVLYGSGPDCYPISFPQDVTLYKINSLMNTNTLIDKPHNMYLQIAINTGVISLVSLLVLWCIYIVNSIKLYWKMSFDSLDKYIGLTCVLSVIGYITTCIFNDNIISVAPIFWIILGLGVSTNIRIKKKLSLKQYKVEEMYNEKYN